MPLPFDNSKNSDPPGLFRSAMALPTADYIPLQNCNMDERNCVLVGMWCNAITDSESEIPIIGTAAFDPCVAIILYNPRTKTGVLRHTPLGGNSSFVGTLATLIRSSTQENLEAHVIGRSALAGPGKNGDNEYSIDMLSELVTRLDSIPNLTLKTFDAYDKPKTNAVAIDTRTGRLIRGSELYKHEGALDTADDFDMDLLDDDFDGRNQSDKPPAPELNY